MNSYTICVDGEACLENTSGDEARLFISNQAPNIYSRITIFHIKEESIEEISILEFMKLEDLCTR